MRTVAARIPNDLADWVDSEFPHGFKQAFIEQCFENLRKVLMKNEMPSPREYASAAVARTMEAVTT